MECCLLGDSLERIDLDMNNDIIFCDALDLISFLKKESECSLLSELCALIGIDSNKNIIYKQMQNRSKDPYHYFIIDPYDYLNFIKKYSCLAVFHSHLVGCEEPSEFDVKTSENCCLAFITYSIVSEKFNIYEPEYKDYDVNIITRLKELI
jgi:proteasome lid subunit RPN8/RPN11